MLVEEINCLKLELEEQITRKDSYHNIYETSVKIDKLLVDYYDQYNKIKKGLSC